MITNTCLFHYATSSNLSEINFIVLEESLLFNSNNSGITNFTFSINASYEFDSKTYHGKNSLIEPHKCFFVPINKTL